MPPPASPKTSAHLATFDLLDDPACKIWVDRVYQLRPHWRQRHPLAPFFTLGLASYLDCSAADPACPYRNPDLLRENNQLLDEHFAPLLHLVATTLSAHFGRPARLTDDAARPGFHIYQPHFAFGHPVASVHRDLQYRDVFPALTPSEADLFSFTLSLSTPVGSGLKLWPDPAAAPEFFPYRNGQLVLHHGLTTHQAILQCTADLDRLTLQGHSLLTPTHALLYW
jgi:hypothetical protein